MIVRAKRRYSVDAFEYIYADEFDDHRDFELSIGDDHDHPGGAL